MSPSDDIVQLLVEMDVLSKEDVKNIQSQQGDVLLSLLLNRRIIQPTQSKEARAVLERVLSCTNQTKKTQAQTELYTLIAEGLDHRTAEAHDELERITSKAWPAVAVAAAEEG